MNMYECFYFEAKLKLEPHRATYIYIYIYTHIAMSATARMPTTTSHQQVALNTPPWMSGVDAAATAVAPRLDP